MSKEATRFKQTEIGELPEEWEVVRLGELAVINPTYPLQRGREYSFIPMEALDEKFPKVKFIQKRIWKGVGARFKYGDVLLARITPSAENGKTAIVDFLETYEFGFGSTEFIVFSPKTEITTSLYVYYLLKWSNVRNKLINQMTGTTGRQRIPNDAPYYVFVPLPPLEEQKRIAGVLRLVDRIAEETKRIINIYERAKKFALKHLLTKGIGHTRFKQTEIGELPEEWEVVRLGDVAVLEMEQIPVFALPKDTLYVGMEHIESNAGRLITDKLPTVQNIKGVVFQFTPEHILYGKLRPYLNKVWRPNFSGVCSTELVPIRCDENQINSDYLKFWLLSPTFVKYAKKFSEGTRMPRVNLKALINAPIPLPPLEEQKQIAEMLNTIDAAIENERRYLGILEKCKKWLLDNLLTGKVRLPQEVDEILKEVLSDAT